MNFITLDTLRQKLLQIFPDLLRHRVFQIINGLEKQLISRWTRPHWFYLQSMERRRENHFSSSMKPESQRLNLQALNKFSFHVNAGDFAEHWDHPFGLRWWRGEGICSGMCVCSYQLVFIYLRQVWFGLLCCSLSHVFIPSLLVCPCSPGAQWGRFHPPRWHLPAAVRDCGGIALNLQDAVLNASHWSTFAWHRGWRSPSAYRGSGDGQTLIYRWDEVRMTLSDWRAVTEPLGHHSTFSAPQGSAIMSRCECVCVPAFFGMSDCVQMCLWVRVASFLHIT